MQFVLFASESESFLRNSSSSMCRLSAMDQANETAQRRARRAENEEERVQSGLTIVTILILP